MPLMSGPKSPCIYYDNDDYGHDDDDDGHNDDKV